MASIPRLAARCIGTLVPILEKASAWTYGRAYPQDLLVRYTLGSACLTALMCGQRAATPQVRFWVIFGNIQIYSIFTRFITQLELGYEGDVW